MGQWLDLKEKLMAWVQIPAHHLPPMASWTNHMAPLLMVYTSQGAYKDQIQGFAACVTHIEIHSSSLN